MGIRGYLVLTEPGAAAATALRIAALPGCEALPAERHDVLLLVTETEDAAGTFGASTHAPDGVWNATDPSGTLGDRRPRGVDSGPR